MPMKVADYILQSKKKLGNAHMSDREFGSRYGVSASTISNARYYGTLSDTLALELAKLLKIDAGEILLVATAERAKDGPVKDALLAYAKKVLASVPSKAVSAIGALAVALGMSFAPVGDAYAGGSGRLRP